MSQRQPFPSQHGSTRRFFLNLFCSCKCPGIHDTFIFWRWKTCWVWSCHLNTWMMMHSTNVYCHPLQLVHLRCLLHGFSSWVHRKAQSLDRCLDSALNCMQSRPRVGWAAVIRQGGVLSWNKLSGYCNSIHWKKHWLLHVAPKFPSMACSSCFRRLLILFHFGDILRIGQVYRSKTGGMGQWNSTKLGKATPLTVLKPIYLTGFIPKCPIFSIHLANLWYFRSTSILFWVYSEILGIYTPWKLTYPLMLGRFNFCYIIRFSGDMLIFRGYIYINTCDTGSETLAVKSDWCISPSADGSNTWPGSLTWICEMLSGVSNRSDRVGKRCMPMLYCVFWKPRRITNFRACF